MPQDHERTLRIGEQIRRELSHLISREIKDPRIGMVTINDVEVSRDLSHAKVFYTVLGEAESTKETQQGLERAAGFLRSNIGRELSIRKSPELHFIYDTTQEDACKLEALIVKARSRDSY